MIKKSKPKFKDTAEMLAFLKEIGKRNAIALKKAEADMKKVEKKYQQEIADYQRLYGV